LPWLAAATQLLRGIKYAQQLRSATCIFAAWEENSMESAGVFAAAGATSAYMSKKKNRSGRHGFSL